MLDVAGESNKVVTHCTDVQYMRIVDAYRKCVTYVLMIRAHRTNVPSIIKKQTFDV